MIDDDVEYFLIKKNYLKVKGYNVTTISNPIEGIEYLKNNDVDVLLVDYFMPEMTGEEVINNIRALNKDIVIVLQTGYAGKKPPLEMFSGVTIQGYFNKDDSTDELQIVVLSALRTAELMRVIRKNAEEKQIKKLKDKFFADKINAVAGEISEKLMSIGGPAMVLEDWVDKNLTETEQKEFVGKRLGYLKDAAAQIRDAVKALNIASETEMTPKSMLEKINALLKIEMQGRKSKLEIEASDDFILINIEEGTLPYLICKDIQNRLETGSQNIKITANREGDNAVIRIFAETGMQEAQKQELKRVADFCNAIKMSIEDNITEIVIERVKK
jgi:CheY-like chemotaxis protein